MNKSAVDLLQKHFDIALEAPDGIKKLRELILTLAMQGKLVPQDPNDQPAGELLKEIEAEMKRLVKEGKIKGRKNASADYADGRRWEIKSDEVPYAVPKGWEWVRLGEIGETQTGTTPATKDADNYGDYIPFIGPGDIQNKQIDYSCDGLSEKGSQSARLIDQNSILMVCIGGSIGKHAITTRKISCNQQINAITPFKSSVLFLFYAMSARFFQDTVVESAGGSATPIINKQKWSSIPLPLPPLAEQKRIVAKIDQLMAGCDALEQLRKRRQGKRLDIHTAAISRLLDTSQPAEVEAAWAFLQAHFGELYGVKENVAELRKAILQLAVMGKLVPQDPTDQPAGELLKEIEAEKKRLVKEGKIKEKKSADYADERRWEIKPEDVPYAVPKGWEWARLREICSKITDGEHQTPPRIPVGFRLLSAKNVRNGYLDYSKCDFISEEHYQSARKRCLPEKGDLLIVSVGGTIGRTSLIEKDTEFALVRSVAIIKPMILNSYFLRLAFLSPLIQSTIHSTKRGGAQPCLYLSEIEQFMLPLPPLAEQKRIVAKIDKLMALCDGLEQGIEAATRKQSAVLGAVLAAV